MSENKAVNHTLKAEVANRGILNTVGWAKNQTRTKKIPKPASKSTRMISNLRHLELSESYIKDKVEVGTCIVVKVDTADNNSDIGTKRVAIPILTKLI